MGRDWIIDVLADLRSFARENDLPHLSDQLEEARLVAEVEIASHPDAPASKKSNDYDAAMAMPRKIGMTRRS